MGKGGVGAPFARLIANLLVMGTGVISRAFVEAYKQALKNGGAAASKGASKAKSLQVDARAILNVKPKATEAEIIEASERLTSMNDPKKGGSSYLQAKVAFARATLINEKPEAEAPKEAPAGEKAEAAQGGKGQGKEGS